MVEWPDEASSDPWEDSLWDDWGLGLGTLGVPMSTVAVEGEDSGEESEERLWACPGWEGHRRDPVGAVALWSEGVVDEDPGETDPGLGGGGMVQASKMASEDDDQEEESDWGEGSVWWPWAGEGGGALGLPWCTRTRSSSSEDSPESNSGGGLGGGFVLMGGMGCSGQDRGMLWWWDGCEKRMAAVQRVLE